MCQQAILSMHNDEVRIDDQLVTELLRNQFHQWLNLPLSRIAPEGTDHVMFKLGEDKVVRLPRILSAAKNLKREYDFLDLLAGKVSMPIPKLIALGRPDKNYPFYWSIGTFLHGKNLSVDVGFDLLDAVESLALFVNELHDVDTSLGVECRRGVHPKTYTVDVMASMEQLKDCYDISQLKKCWQSIVVTPDWCGAPKWIHGDLHPGNFLVLDKKISAIIDFGLAGIGDPACDLMVAWTLLDTKARAIFKKAIQIDEDSWRRAKGWAFYLGVMGYPYYKSSNPVFAAIAKRSLDEVLLDE